MVQLGRPAAEGGIAPHVVAPFEPDVDEGPLDEVLHRVTFSRRDDVVVRLGLLKHQPHRSDVVAGVPPVAPLSTQERICP